jgi:hypothetical protein
MNIEKINVAYNEILVYNEKGKIYYGNSNLANYDIHTWYTAKCGRLNEVEEELNIKFPYTITNEESEDFKRVLGQFSSQKFEDFFDDTHNVFEPYTLDDAINKDIDFIYPIVLFTDDLYTRYQTVDFDKRLIKKVLDKKAKICFVQLTEGFFGSSEKDFIWLDNLSKRYGFDKDHLVFICANLKALESKNKLISKGSITDSYTIIPYNYFQHNLWFYDNGKMSDLNAQESLKKGFYSCLEYNKNNQKTNQFLCFNRVPKIHRMAIFAELKTNEKLTSHITSLGASLINRKYDYLEHIYNYIDNDYKHNKGKLIEFYNKYDSTISSIYDEPDLENNKATNLNLDAHTSSFVNIVTESLISNPTIFFSEKTFKPMFCAQPFILIGNPNSLSKLKEYGFQTFDKWWDESYDTELNFTKRFGKIVDIMEEISTWDKEKMYKITKEMESVFVNNFNVMVNTNEIYETYKKLNFNG